MVRGLQGRRRSCPWVKHHVTEVKMAAPRDVNMRAASLSSFCFSVRGGAESRRTEPTCLRVDESFGPSSIVTMASARRRRRIIKSNNETTFG